MALPSTDLIVPNQLSHPHPHEHDVSVSSATPCEKPCCQTLVWPSFEDLASLEKAQQEKMGMTPSSSLKDVTATSPPHSPSTAVSALQYQEPDVVDKTGIGTGKDIDAVEDQSEVIKLQLSQTRKWILLAVFSCSQFLDIVSVSGALVALADIERALDMPETTGTWVVNAYSIAFAGCLLLAGRVSDMYSPKIVFISGFVVLGIFAVACGVSTKPIMLLVFRGLQGAGGAFTIPSALNMIVNVFPEKEEQATALAIFSGSGALGSVLGLILSGVLLLISWNIVFWIIGVIALPLSIACLFLIPKSEKKVGKNGKLDFVGVGLLTGGLVCLIYSLTTGSTNSVWATPGVLVPLILSITILIPAFFYWETRMPANDALIPPSTWYLPNFALLFAAAMVIYGWFQSVFVPMSTLWQAGYGLSSLQTSLRFLPCGITGGIITIHAAIYPKHYRPRYLLGPAFILCAIGSLLFSFADTEDKYWRFMFPGLVIGTIGGACAYVTCNIAIMQSGPPEFSGVLGAIFNSALQVGTALIVSLMTVLNSTVAKRSPPGSYAPYQASDYLLIGIMLAEGIAVLFLFKEPKIRRDVVIH